MKRYFSIILAVALLLGILPAAYAEEVPAFAIQPSYEGAQVFSGTGLAFVKKGNKWGIIDTQGNEVVAPKYDTPPYHSEYSAGGYYFENGMARVFLDGKWGYVDSTGKEVIAPIYEYAGRSFNDGLVAVYNGEGWGYIDKTGKVVIPFEYGTASAFSEGVAVVQEKGTMTVTLINTKGERIEKTTYHTYIDIFPDDIVFDSGLLFVGITDYLISKNLYGAIDRSGNIIVPFKYSDPFGQTIGGSFDYYKFSEGLAIVGSNYNRKIINTHGQEVAVLTQFDGIKDLDFYLGTFHEGLAAFSMMVDGQFKSGYFDTNGHTVIPAKFQAYSGDFIEGLAYVSIDDKYGFINKTGEFVVSPIYDSVSDFHNGIALVERGGQYGFIDQTGKEFIPPQYQTALFISNLLNGESNGYFFRDVAAVKKNDKWGFIDKSGAEVAAFQYDQVDAFNFGLAPASVNGKWGYIAYPGSENPATEAPSLVAPITAEPGTEYGSTVITAVYENADHLLKWTVSNTPISVPNMDTDQVPAEAAQFEADGSIENSKAAQLNAVSPGQTVGVYETDEQGIVYRFSSHLLQANEVKAAAPVGSLTIAAAPGSVVESVSVNIATYNEANTLTVQVSKTSLPTPYHGSSAPTGAGVIHPYIPASNIQGVVAGNYIGVYEVNAEGKVVAFAQLQVKASDIKASQSTPTPTSTPDNSGGGGSGGSGGGAVAASPTPIPTATATPNTTLNVTTDWAASELKDKASLFIDLKGIVNDQDNKKSIVLPAEVVTLARTAGKPITLISEGAEWTIPMDGITATKELTLTISQQSAATSPKDTTGKISYNLTASADGKSLLSIGGKATVKLPIPAGVQDADKVMVHKQETDRSWSYIGGRVSAGVLTFQTNSFGQFLLAESTKTFVDIQGHWSQRSVEILAARQIATGVNENQFAPNQPVTRAEFAALLVRVLKLEAGTSTFSDVSNNAWYAGEVSAAATAGIIQGNDGAFRPKDAVSRQEAAIMLVRAFEKISGKTATGEGTTQFADSNAISAWAKEAVTQAAELGLIQGSTNGAFNPAAQTTRAESLTTLLRLANLLGL